MTRRTVRRALAATLVAVALSAGTSVAFAETDTADVEDFEDFEPATAQVVVKVVAGHTIDEVAAEYPIAVDSAMLASRGVYLVHATDARYEPKKAKELAKKIEKSDVVVYAEPNLLADIVDTRFHAWPDGASEDAGVDPAAWLTQPAATQLDLAGAHQISQGAGVTVAVLDTGVDPDHPALAGRLVPGWDYVDDDAEPADLPTGADTDGNGHADDAFGHGTFIAGTTILVAPAAQVLPYRVLDADGRGNLFTVAQAVDDAVAAGADVINLSFGVRTKLTSHLLDDAIRAARHEGVHVVAAAGNNRGNRPTYPAANKEVLAVSAESSDGGRLATFANYGDWVALAAPGENLIGPVPGGRYARWNGTSLAAPVVAGQLALARSTAPELKADKITEAVTHTSTKLHEWKLRYGVIDILASLEFARTRH